MIKNLLFLLLFIAASSATAQDFLSSQSTPQNWEEIENEYVQVIYPKGYHTQAIYIANLIEHYSQYVGLSYKIKKPLKVSLIYRPEMAQPNGFVTLAPRRTEFFASSNFFVHTGTLEWHEILSIHEYRHVIQNDAFNKKTVKAVRLFFGDYGQQLLQFFASKSWYMEGDAVYAETKYTEAGRGRSARFLARLKAILLGGDTPSYDQFVSGSYNDHLVSQYLYGYILTSYGYKKYGDDFWNNVNENITARPYPNGIVGAIENASGVDFYDFYYSAFDELRQKWKKDSFPKLKKEEYLVKTNPFKIGKDLYYIKYDLNNQYKLFKNDEELTDLSYSEDFTRIDLNKTHAINSHFLPHWRYGFKGYSDLSLIDLEDGSKSYITSGMRLYNPHFNKSGEKIVATSFDENNNWVIQELDLKGKKLRKLENSSYQFLEAVPISDNEVVAIVSRKLGQKSIVRANLNTGKITTLIPLSFNNFYWLQSDFKNSVLFEAQHKGKVEVFKLNVRKGNIAICTSSRISAYTPSFAGNKIVYTEETINGKSIRTIPQSACRPFEKNSLIDRNKWLSKSDPSDNYNDFKTFYFKDRKSMPTKNKLNYKTQDYSGYDWRAFTPHSWSFFVGSGYGLSLTSDNYLRDFGWNLNLGYQSTANTPYSSVKIDFKRWWPVFSLLADLRKREVNTLGTNDDAIGWDEASYGLEVSLPFYARHNLYNINASIGYSAEQVITDDYTLDEVDVTGKADLLRQSTYLSFSITKDPTHRSIIYPWSMSLLGMYQDADTEDTLGLSSDYRWYGEITLTTPGLFRNNGLMFKATTEEYGDGNGYRFQPAANEIISSTLSRGYDYFATKKYIKTSTNYIFPLFYPDFNLKAFMYFKRIYANLFYDNTKVYVTTSDSPIHISSYGVELMFNTYFLRALPIDFGIRYIEKYETEENETEFFLGTDLSF